MGIVCGIKKVGVRSAPIMHQTKRDEGEIANKIWKKSQERVEEGDKKCGADD